MNWIRYTRSAIDVNEWEQADRSYQMFYGACHSFRSNGHPILLRVYDKLQGTELGRRGVHDEKEAMWLLESARILTDEQIRRNWK